MNTEPVIGYAVKRAALNFLLLKWIEFLDTRQHLMRGLAGERDAENLFRGNAVCDKPGCPAYQDIGFSASGSGDHKHRPEWCRDDGQLLLIQCQSIRDEIQVFGERRKLPLRLGASLRGVAEHG